MIYFLLGLILGFCVIMVIATEFAPDSPKRKALIKEDIDNLFNENYRCNRE